MNLNVNIRGVGFDLGETLISYRDTPLSWAARYSEALRTVAFACGINPSTAQYATAEKVLSRYNTRITPRTHEIPAEQIFNEILRSWEVKAAAHLQVAIETFFNFFQQQMHAYPETIEVLTKLRQSRLPVGLLTDVPYGMPRAFVQRDLDNAGISGFFDVVLTSIDVGVRKPESGGYKALAESLGIIPQEMLYVGNEPKDILGALNAGVSALLIDRTGAGGSYGQQFTLSSLIGIPELLLNPR